MPITQAHCHILGADIVRTTDLEGQTVQVICPELDASTRTCRLRRRALDAGPLGQLVERVAEHALSEPGARCVML